MNETPNLSIERKGSMLETLVENIFQAAGFDVEKNVYRSGFEIDVLAYFGDRTLIIECKQYEKSYLPVKNLILQWKGKNEIIKADKVIFVIYGIDIKEEEVAMAQDYNIIIWGIRELNYFLGLINNRANLCSQILEFLKLRERDIAETNEILLKKMIAETALSGQKFIPVEYIYKNFRKALRNRIITRLKEFGSSEDVRFNHIQFFENIIKTKKVEKFLIFSYQSALSNKQIWEDIKKKLIDLNHFEKEINIRYLNYMERLEQGLKEYQDWFFEDIEKTHYRLINFMLANMMTSDLAKIKIENETLYIKNGLIVMPESKIKDISILEWILTDQNYKIIFKRDDISNSVKKEIHWYPDSLEETVEYTCRLLHEYFGIKLEDKIIVHNLNVDLLQCC